MSTATLLDISVIGPEHNGVRMTPEEFDAATEWDENHTYELVEPTQELVDEGHAYHNDLLPGFELPPGKLLAVAGRWEAKEDR